MSAAIIAVLCDLAMKRPCLGANGRACGTPTVKPRCPTCEAQHQQARNASRPGHRAAHAQARANLAPLVAQGATCYRCHQPIHPGQQWHADNTPNGWHPSHRTCNEAAEIGRAHV